MSAIPRRGRPPAIPGGYPERLTVMVTRAMKSRLDQKGEHVASFVRGAIARSLAGGVSRRVGIKKKVGRKGKKKVTRRFRK